MNLKETRQEEVVDNPSIISEETPLTTARSEIQDTEQDNANFGAASASESKSEEVHEPNDVSDTNHIDTNPTDVTSSADEGQEVPAIDGPKQKVYTDGVTLAQEIESLRAAQLRLKIDQEVAHSMLQLEMVRLRGDLEQGMAVALQEFREEVMAASNAPIKALQTEYQKLAQNVNTTLSERQVVENRWKATFEDTIAARIQDIWSGLHSTSRKLQENMQYLQAEVVTQEETSRDVNTVIDSIKASNERLDRDTKKHANMLAEQEKDMEHLHGMCTQASVRLDEQDAKLTNQVEMIYHQMENSSTSVQDHIKAYDTFVAATDKTFTMLASDLTACSSTIAAHQSSLHTLNTVAQRHNEDLIRTDERITTTDARIGSIDGRVALAEKKLTTTVGVMQEHYQERQQIVAAIQANLNQAALERTSMKHITSDLGFCVQEVQHKLHEVDKLAHTTEMALNRTAAELPKMHALVTTNSSNIAKNRQSIRDITTMIGDDRLVASTLRSEFDKEVSESVARFTAAEERDAQAQDAIANAATNAGHVKAELEARIHKHGNLIHQLNTMVDSLAITETTEDMEDKMSTFALSCAQLGLKLEFFGRKASSVDGACIMKDDVKAALAVLLTKVIRFLGSGVSIEQNKYLLTAKRSQAVDPITGQVIMEIPPQHVLESFRIATAATFTAKTRTAMDQLEPVLRTNRTSIEFRDAFERKLKFVLEFGLANLFPNMGKPKNPLNRRGGEFGTCIACDRPIDSDDPQDDSEDSDIPRRHRAQQQEALGTSSSANETIPEQQRSTAQIQQDTSTSRPSSAAVRNRIDTKTAVRGRSGGSNVRPKSSGESVHYAPGASEFVYRGGFRIPKATSNAVMSASVNSLLNLSLSSSTNLSVDRPAEELTGNGPLDVENSCLEKVALLGKHQVVEIPSIANVSGAGNGTAAVRAARPHTAPLRMKSLPRLDVAPTSASVDISAGGGPLQPLDTTTELLSG
ncbi:Chromosome segregation ATPase [Phytophthora cinnamomi]|uniref:Chromosome segregation ATPase n=1 Tax=Phytophthora cinnamomi TaxID=4785 RepID=UPI00355947C2|nr:Chromosome segregation ATPase [Phytophthora cinnamomi]